jgi:hypothetical protein
MEKSHSTPNHTKRSRSHAANNRVSIEPNERILVLDDEGKDSHITSNVVYKEFF